MLCFFRPIQQWLLAENKLSKDVLYAIGKTVLVVIGILIALFFNDLNAEAKDRQSELSYLNRFDGDP